MEFTEEYNKLEIKFEMADTHIEKLCVLTAFEAIKNQAKMNRLFLDRIEDNKKHR